MASPAGRRERRFCACRALPAARPCWSGSRRGIAVFGADLWPGDWNPMTPQHERALLLKRLTAAGGGIVLLHDTQAKTAAMLPELLRELKRRDYRVVHVVPAGVNQPR